MRFLRICPTDAANFEAFDGPAFLDGYAFGDRLLEGVLFRIDLAPQGPVASLASSDEAYFATLNTGHWLREAAKAALTDTLTSAPESGCDVGIYRPDAPLDAQCDLFPDSFTVLEADGTVTRYPA